MFNFLTQISRLWNICNILKINIYQELEKQLENLDIGKFNIKNIYLAQCPA